MRGTPSTVRRAGRRSRIIPAHAGNTSYSDANYMSNWDHPRACGEHEAAVTGGLTDAGSSPRMRGTPSGCRRPTWPPRIIPAHAGNTRVRSGRARRLSDHPRACGEHNMRSYQYWMYRGSSPRMRGTLGISMFSHTNDGIIPAHAGNTLGLLIIIPNYRDHPRACGEHPVCADGYS